LAVPFDETANGYGLAGGDAIVSSTDRLRRVTAVLDNDWRPDSWDAASKVLTPDIDDWFFRTKPRCLVAGCWGTGAVRSGICQGCTHRFRQSNIDDPGEWAATAPRKERLRRLNGELCRVTENARRCQRPAEGALDLCNRHNNLWTDRRHAGITLDEFLAWAKPLKSLGRCRADACQLAAAVKITQLCTIHQNEWRKADQPAAGSAAFTTWAATVRSPVGWVIVLRGLSELLTAELLYAIQQREREEIKTDPVDISKFVQWLRAHPADTLSAVNPDDFDTRGHYAATRFARFAVDRVRLVESTIDDERLRDRWDLRVFGKGVKGRVDFRVIPIDWLRTAAKQWAEASVYRVSEETLAEGVMTFGLFATTLLTRGDGGEDPTVLSRRDIDRFLTTMPRLKSDRTGERFSQDALEHMVSRTGTVLREAREFGFLDELPATCSLQRGEFKTSTHRGAKPGKAIPTVVIAQLDEHVEALRRIPGKNVDGGYGIRSLGPLREHVGDLAALAYLLLRGTGRRCGEIATLRVNCLTYDGDGKAVLVYDNHKARRPGRRLPLEDSDLIDAINNHQQMIRDAFPGVADADLYMFPRVHKNPTGQHHIPAQSLSKWMRAWVDGLADLHNGIPEPGGGHQAFDRAKVHPHAFRHTYAQRLADHGVSPHTLRELMDHLSMETTLGYYRVGDQRKRDAMQIMNRHTADHHGNIAANPAPMSDVAVLREELHWVAVPFGKCSEPSNIKAGGHACPIRWQCPGCPHFQSDPSYLPELQTHADTLRRQREAAITVGADTWAIDNLTNEINAVQHHIDIQHDHLGDLDDDERLAVEQATRDLRKARQLLPLIAKRTGTGS
jgi:integrase